MTLLCDYQIKKLALECGMITPFVESQKSDGVISYGLSSYGYDVRLNKKFKVIDRGGSGSCWLIDPKNPKPDIFRDIEGDTIIIPPNSFILGTTMETFKIPRHVLGACFGKSTYARWGIIVNVTPLEPEWEGVVTMEFSNTTPRPVKMYAGEGCAQFVFFDNQAWCKTSYKDRAGKYQGQKEIELGKVLHWK